MAGDILEQAFMLLRQESAIEVSAIMRWQLDIYLSLVRKWNGALSLVSSGDALCLEEKHLVDALSLVPYVARYAGPSGWVLDIGSGGGFPILPVKCLLPDLRCTLIERNTRKIGFLHRATTALNFSHMEIVHGGFPDAMQKIDAQIVTARAVESPDRVVPAILRRMPANCVFLCQTDPNIGRIPATFHVEHLDDNWQQTGLRRGKLYRITHAQP